MNVPATQKEAKKLGEKFYFTGKPCVSGHVVERFADNGVCVECQKLYTKRTREKNKDKIAKRSKSSYNTNEELYINHMWYRARNRATKKGVEFSITKKDIVIPEKCPVFDKEFVIGTGRGPSEFSPSLDRIDNSKGYIKGNIQVISHKANTIKSNYTAEDLFVVANFLKSL